MDECIIRGRRRERWLTSGLIFLTCAVTLAPGLGSASCLTYHEAFVVQGAREIVASGQWSEPTIAGLPWLEKPPLPFWLVASVAWLAGGLSVTLARVPFALAASALAIGIAQFTTRYYGRRAGLLAGSIQATTAWWVFRGRLAEADIVLACLLTWTLVAFDQVRVKVSSHSSIEQTRPASLEGRFWECIFFSLLGLSALVKGIGFGAVLVLSVILTVILWGREWHVLRRLLWAPGWALGGLLAFSWPLLIISQHGIAAAKLWLMHISDRIVPPTGHGQFAGEAWLSYALAVFGQGLPWTPVAIIGAAVTVRQRYRVCNKAKSFVDTSALAADAGDRLLWAWSLLPLVLVSITRARNAHYAIYAMVPWSVWASVGLIHVGGELRLRRWSIKRLERLVRTGFSVLALAYGLGYYFAGPRLDRRSLETTFYEQVGHKLHPGEQLTLLYDTWDRDPYYTPFGQIPHDLALRLFYLQRRACWHFGVPSLADHFQMCQQVLSPISARRTAVIIGRDRDLDELKARGTVEVVAHSAAERWDRHYVAVRYNPTDQ